MRKTLALAIMLAGIVLAQENQGVRYAGKTETVGTTQYVGLVRTTVNTTPTTNDASWSITKYIYDSEGNVLAWGFGYSTNATGDLSLSTLKWSERASSNTVYKLVQ